ncbi:MAG TPA: 4Fe-4S dicluster domain-containing protein [Anaerolineales bacterium]|nr:4Fe-4S dicluster domain-containing protein [Anaerolineales bacterium]HRK90561.1 4Fe-4S dicluster domain-containing protein [Anaerolineales bacterium]
MPQMTEERVRAGLTQEEDLSLLNEVSMKTAGVSHLEMCIQCGSCGGSCPSAADMDHTPRMLFAMLRAGMRELVLQSNTPWICVSCYHCVVRCPQEVHITDVMYTLKGMAIREKKFRDAVAPEFSETFVDMVEKYGRSFEFGLATRHYLKHAPLRLVGMSTMGLGMLAKGRMSMTPRKIKGMTQLKSILKKAKEMELTS